MQGSFMEVIRLPGWLVIRLAPPDDSLELADALWNLMEQESTFRVVLELDQLKVLRSRLVGELVRLHKRIQDCQGSIRLCGLSEANQTVLKMNRLDNRLPHYADRTTAIAE